MNPHTAPPHLGIGFDARRWPAVVRRCAPSVVAMFAIVLTATLQPAAAAVLPAIANPDNVSAVSGVRRTVAAPGVLANDIQVGAGYTADLVTDVGRGTLTLDADGGFVYRSDAGFVGTDRFRYRILGSVLGPSNTTTVTISVTAPPPTPSPTPVPTRAPTPAPTLLPTPLPTPKLSLDPVVTLPPVPSIEPSPSTEPTSSPVATARPTATATPQPTPTPRADVTDRPDIGPGPAGPAGPAGPIDPGGPASSARPGTVVSSPLPPLTVPSSAAGIELDMSPALSLGGLEWAIPALVLTVPGILIVIVVSSQALLGLAWLPVTRRWLGGDRRRGVQALGAGVR